MLSASQTLDVPGYQVLRRLGNGARSTIWEVRHRQTKKHFALKRVIRHGKDDQRFVEQALNEAHVAKHLDHPVLRKIHGIRKVRMLLRLRELHLVMELCQGQSLQDRPPGTIREVVRIFTEVAEALVHMNAKGWVHSDIKPNNILVADDGTVKIIDLGQSCPLGKIKDRIQGTPDFIAPEQVKRQPLDGRTDVFNYGATLYWVVTRKPISTAMPKQGQVTLKADLQTLPPEQINPNVPPSLSKLIMDCIELLPSRRPQSMDAIMSRLGLVQRAIDRGRAPGAE